VPGTGILCSVIGEHRESIRLFSRFDLCFEHKDGDATLIEVKVIEDSKEQPAAGSARATLNLTEVAELLGCARSSVYKWAQQGKLPTIRIGRRVLVPREPFERWLASGNGASEGGG
jgi:excisionase family DNA binding protein